MKKMKKPISILLSILMMLSVFSGMTLTVGAAEKTIAEGVIYKLGDTIVLPGDGAYYVKDSERHPAQRIYSNGTITQFEGDEYSYTLEISNWGIYAYMETFDYWEELNQGQSVLGITFTGSGTESDPYLPKLAIGVVESTWAGEGEGTEASPWLIKDLNDLRTLSANVADGMNYSGKYLKLTADIDCGSDNWEAIGGANAKMFMGTFDGDSHTITYKVAITNDEKNKGLFYGVGAGGTVKNLNVAGSISSTNQYAGYFGGVAVMNYGTIINCYSAIDITTAGDGGAGGIAAYNEEGATISYCAASGTITWTGGSDFYAYVAGITGSNYYGYVNNCAMLGDVSAQNSDGDEYAGRLIGRQFDASYSHDCYYIDTMTATGEVNSDSVTAKTADELKAIGQAAIDAGYTVYGLALGGSLSNPDQEAADAVIALIDAIGTVEYTDACKAKIDAARAEYDDLTADQQALVTNIDTLTAAETAYANLKAAADAAADPVSYLVWDDAAQKLVEKTGDNACKTYTEVTADTATFEDGMWYVVNGEILNGNRITVTGTAHLILTDGSKLTTNNGINVANGSTLNIYGQGAGTGTVTAKGGSNKGAGIGGKQNESGGTVNIYGGTVTATGSGGGAGIGGGWASVGTGGTGGTITIYGGTVTANGSGMGGAGIGGGTSQSAGIVTIYGGTVTANGNYTSPGIGPGAKGDGGTLTVCGGSVTAVGADHSDAIACTVKNTFPGTGWENVNGTGDGTPIEINTEGQEYGFKKIQFLGVASIPNDQQAADAVIAKISAIGTVEYTAESKAKVEAAKAAYDALTDEQKALVTNVETLTAAEAAVADFDAANDVIDLIDAIGTVENTAESKAKVAAAKAAYDALTPEQKALVTNVETLTAAVETVANFSAEPVQYTVTVPSDCTVSQTLPAGSEYYLATVQAPLKKGSTYFTYWVDAEGRIVGTYRTYTFYVGSDMALTPVYSTEADYAAERAKAVYAARALNVISKGDGAYAILAEHSVSTTDSLNSHGVLVTTDASLANADAMNCDNQNENIHNFTASTTKTTKTGMLQINAQLTGDTVYVRPYIVDGSGEYHYFDIKSFALTATGDSAEEVVMLDSTDLDLTAENADGDAAAEAPADDADEAASIISTILEVVMNLVQRIVNYIKLALSIVK